MSVTTLRKRTPKCVEGFEIGARCRGEADGGRSTRDAPGATRRRAHARSPLAHARGRQSTVDERLPEPHLRCVPHTAPLSPLSRSQGLRKEETFSFVRHVRRFVDDRNRGCRPGGSAPSPRGEARRRGRPQDRPRQRVGRRAPRGEGTRAFHVRAARAVLSTFIAPAEPSLTDRSSLPDFPRSSSPSSTLL